MRVSMRVDYGVRAMVDLALHARDRPAQAVEIAARQHIPEPYLEHLMTTLHKSGLVASRRGPQGGHSLAKAPSEISLGQIVVTLEGRNAPLDCIETPTGCGVYTVCAQRDVWESVEKAFIDLLEATSLESLASRQKEKEELGLRPARSILG